MHESYAELHCLSYYSFLRAVSSPEELINQAEKYGYQALAITDECSVSGVVRAYQAAKHSKVKLIVGSEFITEEGVHFVVLAPHREAYAELCALITHARRAASKGKYQLYLNDIKSKLSTCLLIWIPGQDPELPHIEKLCLWFKHRLWIAFEFFFDGYDDQRRSTLARWSAELDLPMVAATSATMHVEERRVIQDVITAIRHKKTLKQAGFELPMNASGHLRSLTELQDLYPKQWLDESSAIANQCYFDLGELRYEYPEEVVPKGHSAKSYLREITEQGVVERWPQGIDKKLRQQIERELKLINELSYEPFFLTVYDIVKFARSKHILCQGRGSAANSAVCYALGITEVDPARMNLLFERFISKERDEPPDIDVDFEHQRREEVIQYIYKKYGRERTALAATIVTYRSRSALREVAKVLGFAETEITRLAKAVRFRDGDALAESRIREAGFDPHSRLLRQLVFIVQTIRGFPRHLSQHVGGFVISRGPLSSLVPIENAAMPERTVIQWEKDDLEALGLLKVDILGLGMLSVIRRSLQMVNQYRHAHMSMSSVPAEDPEVYRMIGKGETVGVFQIESRAQMAMLPRLKPKKFYDLVIEIAIVRPGPIQGDMVHPYLRRRNGLEEVSYPSDAVRVVLERTLGVPIFQEQVMKLAVVAAGFTPGEADQLRRSMAAWKRKGGLEKYRGKLINGMLARGYSELFAERIFQQIKGFGEYGFPESHSASFALLAYVSSWLKCYEPAIFTCALLNSQPMGFYRPAQLVQEARRQGVEVRAVDVSRSEVKSSIEKTLSGKLALRLGLHRVKGLSEEAADTIVTKRNEKAWLSFADFYARTNLKKDDLEALAAANALEPLCGNRHHAYWLVQGRSKPYALSIKDIGEGQPLLRTPQEGENIALDYNHLGLTIRRHPLALLRQRLAEEMVLSSEQLTAVPNGGMATVAGIVLSRQRPMTAGGVTFITLEDETGFINVVIWKSVALKQRQALINATLLKVYGQVQREHDVTHFIARRLDDKTNLLGRLRTRSRDFH